ncbi:MAG: ribosome-binding factor A [Microbacteriaceae bacterium]|nr:ribosome-binding factor A [Microbacteriaceae bacterium]
MVDAARARRLAERIKVLTADALEKVVKDPDLGFVTITDVRVTPDLSHAKIFYTFFGDAAARAKSNDVIERHRGKIRRQVGTTCKLNSLARQACISSYLTRRQYLKLCHRFRVCQFFCPIWEEQYQRGLRTHHAVLYLGPHSPHTTS